MQQIESQLSGLGVNSREMMSFVSSIVAPEVLGQLLQRRLDDINNGDVDGSRMVRNIDPETEEEVESFFAVPLISAHGWLVRAHVWPDQQNNTEDIHTHTTPFASQVIFGHFDDVVWTPSEGGDKFYEYTNDVRVGFSPEPVRMVKLLPQPQRLIRRGSGHFMDQRTIHNASMNGAGFSPVRGIKAATVVVRHQESDTPGSIFTLKNNRNTDSFPEIVDIDGVEVLRSLISAISDV
jgi:hypothetical protein